MAQKNNILVTGGAGFIGSHVTDELIKAGHNVSVLDDLNGGFRDNVNPKAEFVQGSVVDEVVVKNLFATRKFDYLFHLAAYAAEGLSHFIKRFNYENNLIGSINLINAAVNHNVKCFIFTSSIAVYGAGQLPMSEDMIPRPEDPYGIAKYAVEQELEVTCRQFGLPYIIFRPHNVFGERQNIGDKYRNVIGIFMNQIMSGRPLTIFGDGEQQRAFTYISDVAAAIARSIEVPGAYNQVFNVGGDEVITVNKLAGLVQQAMESSNEVRHLPPRGEVKFAFAAHEKIKRLLDYQTTVTIQEGLGRMAAWAKARGPRQSRKFSHIEISKNLPPVWLE